MTHTTPVPQESTMQKSVPSPDAQRVELYSPEGVAESIGAFTTAGPLRCTDPCYSPGTWCTGLVDVLPGRWNAHVVRGPTNGWGTRTYALLARHESVVVEPKDTLNAPWHAYDFDAGVDSGSFGFFDQAAFDKMKDDDDLADRWYEMAGNTRIDLDGKGGARIGGVVGTTKDDPEPFGALSSSGFGDGGYTVLAQLDGEGRVVSLLVVFCPKMDEEG